LKLKLNKKDHLAKFQLLAKIEKNKIATHENKTSGSDKLIFTHKDGKLYLYISNNISSAYLYLSEVDSEFKDFALDINKFTNAFSNFTSDEMQCVYADEDNQIKFGNKTSRGAITVSPVSENASNFDYDFQKNSGLEWKKLNKNSLLDSIKYTSFSCAPEYDEYPYTSLMFFLSNEKFNAQSSDKHRISFYGEKFDSQQSYLIAKQNAELLASFIHNETDCEYLIYKGKMYITWEGGGFCTSLENNNHTDIYELLVKPFNDSKEVLNINIDKNLFLKSIKFISTVSCSSSINLLFQGSELILSSSSSDGSEVADKVSLEEEVASVDANFLYTHILKALDMINDNQIKLTILECNSFYILYIHNSFFKHLIFPIG
jgi:hypothetical protein